MASYAKTLKHRLNLYFETKQQIALLKKAAAKVQETRRPNLSRYCVEAALSRMKLDLATEEHTKHTTD